MEWDGTHIPSARRIKIAVVFSLLSVLISLTSSVAAADFRSRAPTCLYDVLAALIGRANLADLDGSDPESRSIRGLNLDPATIEKALTFRPPPYTKSYGPDPKIMKTSGNANDPPNTI